MTTKNRDLLNTDSTQQAYQQLTDAAPAKKSKKSKTKQPVTVLILPPAPEKPKATPVQQSRVSSIEELTDDSTVSYCCGLFTRKKPAPLIAKPAPTEQTMNQVITQNIVRKL
jgi:hypothetical protein